MYNLLAHETSTVLNMSFTPSHSKMTTATWGARLTPSNGSIRSPIKFTRNDLQISLKQIIGTTVNSANALDSLPSGQSFAFVAGAAAILATVDDNFRITQRFFRARPTACALNGTTSVYDPGVPTSSSVEPRTRTAAALRDAGLGMNAFGSPTPDWGESPSSRSWTSKERVKAATSVSLSSDGKYLAVGEVRWSMTVYGSGSQH